jgi:hypothetical protein
LAGSSGRMDRDRATLFAQHGAEALTIRWFGGVAQRPAPHEVPETFFAAVDRLAPHCDWVAVVGSSFGVEAALLTAVHDERVHAVVAVAPSAVVCAGYDGGRCSSHWTLEGEQLPFVPLLADWVPSESPPYRGLYAPALPPIRSAPRQRLSRSSASIARSSSSQVATTRFGRVRTLQAWSRIDGPVTASPQRSSLIPPQDTASDSPVSHLSRVDKAWLVEELPRRTPHWAAWPGADGWATRPGRTRRVSGPARASRRGRPIVHRPSGGRGTARTTRAARPARCPGAPTRWGLRPRAIRVPGGHHMGAHRARWGCQLPEQVGGVQGTALMTTSETSLVASWGHGSTRPPP